METVARKCYGTVTANTCLTTKLALDPYLVLSPSILSPKHNSLALTLAVVSCCPSKGYKLFGVDSVFTWVALLLL